jgi:hypothetical protein
MSYLYRVLSCRHFGAIDRPMEKLREVRDSYRAMNVEIYGEQMARMLNDW